MPRVAGEEQTDSREFWMLIGSIFLLMAAAQIIFYTSLPVWAPLYNKISGSEIAPPEDPVSFYNNIQVWFAIIVAFLSGLVQFLKYKKTGMKTVVIRLGLLLLISIVLTVMLLIAQEVRPIQLMLFTFSGIFAVIANTYYLFVNQKGKLMKAGGSIAHIGFGFILIALLLSGYKQHVISIDSTGVTRNWDFGKGSFEKNFKESQENVLMFRNSGITMGDYVVTYLGDSVVQNDPPMTVFKVRYQKIHPKTGKVMEDFLLYPNAYVNPKGQKGLSSNPSTRHYLTYDVFSYISSISDPDKSSDTSSFREYQAAIGDTIFLASGYLVFEGVTNEITNPEYKAEKGTYAVQANLEAHSLIGKLGELHPIYLIKEDKAFSPLVNFRDLGLNVGIGKIDPEQGLFQFNIKERAQQDDYVVMKVIVFPFINLLWLGILTMVGGLLIAFRNRARA